MAESNICTVNSILKSGVSIEIWGWSATNKWYMAHYTYLSSFYLFQLGECLWINECANALTNFTLQWRKLEIWARTWCQSSVKVGRTMSPLSACPAPKRKRARAVLENRALSIDSCVRWPTNTTRTTYRFWVRAISPVELSTTITFCTGAKQRKRMPTSTIVFTLSNRPSLSMTRLFSRSELEKPSRTSSAAPRVSCSQRRSWLTFAKISWVSCSVMFRAFFLRFEITVQWWFCFWLVKLISDVIYWGIFLNCHLCKC